MGVLTGFYRVPPELIPRLRSKPDLIGILLGMKDGGPADLGLKKAPPSMDIDKSWEDILRFLRGTGAKAAYGVLSKPSEIPNETGAWVRSYTALQVKQGAAALAAVDVQKAQRFCETNEVSGYDERLEGALLGYVVGHFKSLRTFWGQAAKADQAIIADDC
jgi:hypothetical protein